jgi:hypothetical protein
MVTNEEQTAATAPLVDDPATFNTVEATFHRLCVAHPEPLSSWLTSSLVDLHARATGLLKPLGCQHFTISLAEEAAAKRRCCRYRLRIKPPLHALATATSLTMTVEYQVVTTALPRVNQSLLR